MATAHLSWRAFAGLLALGASCSQPAAREQSAGSAATPSALDAAASSAAAPSDPGSAAVATDQPVDRWVEQTLRTADPRFGAWLADAENLRLQVLVTEVSPDGQTWSSHGFRVDAEYFYPASAIKSFLAVATLRALDARVSGQIPLGTRIRRCQPLRKGCEPPEQDEDKEAEASEADDKPKHKKLYLGEEITKLLSYSDNDSYNRLWDIVGHSELNAAVAELGFSSLRFHHRMDAPAERSRSTVRVQLLPPAMKGLDLPARKSSFEPEPTPVEGLLIGTSYLDRGKRLDEPMSFARKNYVSLRELQLMNVSLLFPERPEAKRLGLSELEREHLIRAMSANLSKPANAAEHHPLSAGVLEVMPNAKQLRIVGKSGRAYGFHIDNSWVEDKSSKRSFFVTATVYANPDGVLNDDDYTYEETSKPLLRALGAALARKLLLAP